MGKAVQSAFPVFFVFSGKNTPKSGAERGSRIAEATLPDPNLRHLSGKFDAGDRPANALSGSLN